MELIRNIVIKDVNCKFYKGIDFDIALNHPNDGSEGLLLFIVDDFISELKSYNRDCKIESIIDDTDVKYFEWNSISDNNYIAIYQTEGRISNIHNLISKIINNANNQWVPIAGLKTGAWRIGGANVYN
jgi:hypothetical protein